MPYVNFGTKDEPGFELIGSPDLIAVRTRSRRPVRGVGPVARPTTAEVADGALVATFPDAGVEVYQVSAATGRGAWSCSPPGMATSRWITTGTQATTRWLL